MAQVKKRKLWIAGGGALLLVLVIQFPSILSSGIGRSIVTGKVNNSVPGSLSIDNCDMGWRKGLSCDGIVYEDRQQGIRVDLEKVTCSQGLFPLLIAPMNLGTVTADKPTIVVQAAPPPVVEQGQKKIAPSTKEKSAPAGIIVQPKEKKIAKTDEAPIWDKIAVTLRINEATVKYAVDEKTAQTLVRNGSLDAVLASSVIDFKMDAQEGDGAGRALASGLINLPSRKVNVLDALKTDFKLDFIDLQVEPFFTMAIAGKNLPTGSGKFSSEIVVKTMGIDTLAARGSSRLSDVRMEGGFLDEDQPEFERFSLDFDVKRDVSSNWEFSNLQFSSDFATMSISGDYGRQDFELIAQGVVELPKLLEQLPNLFKAEKDTRLEQGSVNVTINLARKERLLQINAKTVMDNLSGQQDGHSFAWDSPVNLDFECDIKNKEAEIKKLTLTAPFLNLEGRGDPDDFTLNGSANLNKAALEIGKIFHVGWDVEGLLNFSAQSEKTADNRYVVATDVKIADFSLSQNGKNIVPPHQLSFNGRLNTPKGFPETKTAGMDLVFDIYSWPLTINGALKDIYRRDGSISASYQLESEMQMGRVTELLHNFDKLHRETTIAGVLQLRASGFLENDRLAVRELDSLVENFIVYRQQKIFRDPAVRLLIARPMNDNNAANAADNSGVAVRPLKWATNQAAFYDDGGGDNYIDLHNHRIELRGLAFTSNVGRVNAGRISIKDWQQLPAIRSLQLDGKADLAKLTTVLQQAGALAEDTDLDGNVVVAVDLADSEMSNRGVGNNSDGTVNLEVNNLKISQAGKLVFVDEKMALTGRVYGKPTDGDIEIESLTLESLPLQIEAAGRLQSSGQSPHFTLTGEMTPDFTSLMSLLNTLQVTDIKMSGREKNPFSLYYPLSADPEDETIRKLRFKTTLYTRQLSKAGVEVTDLEIPVSMEDGMLRAKLTGEVNDGELTAAPHIDYAAVLPTITLPANSPLLSNVQIAQPLVDGVLKRIHPLFGLLAQPSGAVSCRMDHFAWPLVEKGSEQADFSVVFDVSKTSLQPAGALQKILKMAGIEQETLILEQSEITCNGAQGRVSCTPLKMLAAGTAMTLGGSVGFDGSLDYLLEIPVTKNLVGKEGYRVLKGTILKVPIKGDSERSFFDAEALTDAAADLVGQAAKQAAGDVIEKEVKKVLPDLLQGFLK